MPYGQSPWEDASNALGGMGNNMNSIAMAVARMRFQQAAQQQRQALMLGQLALRQQLDNSTEARNTAQAGKANADTQMQQQKINTAGQLGDSTWSQFMPRVGDQPGAIAGMDVGAASNMARVAGLAEKSRALFGRGMDPYALHNVPEGAMAVNPFGQPVAVGAPKLQFGPPSATPMFSTGDQAGPQLAPRPLAGEHMGNVYSALVRARAEGTMAQPGERGFDKPMWDASEVALGLVQPRGTTPTNVPMGNPKQTTASGNAPAAGKNLDPNTAKQFLMKAGGDKDKARQMARDAGFSF